MKASWASRSTAMSVGAPKRVRSLLLPGGIRMAPVGDGAGRGPGGPPRGGGRGGGGGPRPGRRRRRRRRGRRAALAEGEQALAVRRALEDDLVHAPEPDVAVLVDVDAVLGARPELA